MSNLPGANKPDPFTITPEQKQAHEAARPIVRAELAARGLEDELAEMLGVAS